MIYSTNYAVFVEKLCRMEMLLNDNKQDQQDQQDKHDWI
ncbi:hypothetical protein J715_3624 [Acinetobacter baumannii 1571545]|nr:hypothetical protein J715_3624 [Acinetobacter baumannii 1571545]